MRVGLGPVSCCPVVAGVVSGWVVGLGLVAETCSSKFEGYTCGGIPSRAAQMGEVHTVSLEGRDGPVQWW